MIYNPRGSTVLPGVETAERAQLRGLVRVCSGCEQEVSTGTQSGRAGGQGDTV